MPRKKRAQVTSPAELSEITNTGATVAVADADQPIEPLPIQRPAWIDGPPTPVNGQRAASPEGGKNWGEPYKAIFNCPEQGFELGEHRQFKQRVFRFAEKPEEDVIAELKELGFAYRAHEKSWTVPATADTRKLSDELARKWAGPNYIRSVER